MKITVRLSRPEAQRILGVALSTLLAPAGRYTVEEVSWSSYGSMVEIELSDEPAPALEELAARSGTP